MVKMINVNDILGNKELFIRYVGKSGEDLVRKILFLQLERLDKESEKAEGTILIDLSREMMNIAELLLDKY